MEKKTYYWVCPLRVKVIPVFVNEQNGSYYNVTEVESGQERDLFAATIVSCKRTAYMWLSGQLHYMANESEKQAEKLRQLSDEIAKEGEKYPYTNE